MSAKGEKYRRTHLALCRERDAAHKRRKRLDPAYREACRVINKRWRDNRTDEQKKSDVARHAAWLAAHPEYNEKRAAKTRASYDPVEMKRKRDLKRPQIQASLRAYYRKNKERFFAAARIRRALKKAAAINLAGIQEFVRAVKSKPYAICYYCNSKVPLKRVHFDHIVPLAKGGAHSVENLCVSCNSCNLSKGAKSVVEWARLHANQQLLSL